MAFRTQKISQMTPKGANLEATDLIEVSTIESGSYVTRSITGQEIIDAIPVPPSGITIGSTAITSGVVGRVLFEGAGNVVQESSSLFWDNTNNRLGIGTSSPTAPFTIKFTGQTGQDFYISGSGSNTHNIGGGNTLNIVHPNITAGASFGTAYGSVNRYFSIGSSSNLNARLAVLGGGTTSATSSFLVLNNSSTELFRIRDNGNIGINTTTDAGFRLDVNGTARVQGATTISAALTVSVSNLPVFNLNDTLQNHTWQFRSNGTTLWFIANGQNRVLFRDNGNVLIGTTTDAGFRLDVNGTARVATSILVGASSTQGIMQTGVFRGTYFNDYANNFTIFQVQSNGNASFYQGLAIGTSANAVASAQVEIVSTTKGFLPPRMTTTQKNAIASPAAGLMVYDTTLNVISYYNGTMWI